MAKEAYYFSHDSNARHDPKIGAMRSVYGSEGYGWFWILVEMMRESEDYKLDMQGKYIFNAYAMQMHSDSTTIERYVLDCIHEFDLFKSDGKHFWSESLLRRMQLREKTSEKRRAAANKRWANAPKTDESMQMHSNSNANGMQGKESKLKESKGNEIKEKQLLELSESLSFFSTQFALMPSPFQVEKLNKLIDEFTDTWVLKAMEISLLANNRDLRYVTGILTKWKERGIPEPWKEENNAKSERFPQGVRYGANQRTGTEGESEYAFLGKPGRS